MILRFKSPLQHEERLFFDIRARSLQKPRVCLENIDSREVEISHCFIEFFETLGSVRDVLWAVCNLLAELIREREEANYSTEDLTGGMKTPQELDLGRELVVRLGDSATEPVHTRLQRLNAAAMYFIQFYSIYFLNGRLNECVLIITSS